MRIWGETPKVAGIYGKKKDLTNINKVTNVQAKKDAVSISEQAKDFQLALKTIKNIPDIRIDRVNEVIQKINSGTYDVKGSDIAEKIIRSSFDKKA